MSASRVTSFDFLKRVQSLKIPENKERNKLAYSKMRRLGTIKFDPIRSPSGVYVIVSLTFM
jgi:hypothetical protein